PKPQSVILDFGDGDIVELADDEHGTNATLVRRAVSDEPWSVDRLAKTMAIPVYQGDTIIFDAELPPTSAEQSVAATDVTDFDPDARITQEQDATQAGLGNAMET